MIIVPMNASPSFELLDRFTVDLETVLEFFSLHSKLGFAG
jgi:hypothetical protein